MFELQNQAEHNTTNTQAASDYSSTTAMMLVTFWSERDFYIISDCKRQTTINLKTYEQSKNFFNLANTQSSSGEFLKEKHHTFIGICSLFTWFNMQILNLCYR